MTEKAEQTQPIVVSQPIPRVIVRALVGLAATQVALTFAAMLFAYTANARSDRQWCGLLSGLHQSYQQTPPTTPSGQAFRNQIDALYVQFDCADVRRH